MIRVDCAARYNVPQAAIEDVSVALQTTGTHYPMTRSTGSGKLRPTEYYFARGVYQLPIPRENARYQIRFRANGAMLTLTVPTE